MMKFYYRTISAVLLVLHPMLAQITGKLTIDDGLSQNYIYDILLDRRGFLWFGTKEGLNRYDGYSFVVYRNDPLDPHSLSNNTVTSLHEDNAGGLWVGTISGGLNRFDRSTETFSRIKLQQSHRFTESIDNITAIFSDSDSMVWIGTHGSGLFRYDPQRREVKRFFPDSVQRGGVLFNSGIADISEWDGMMWIATNSAVSSFDLQTEKKTTYVHPKITPRNGITTLFKTSRNELLVAHRNGVDRFDGKNFNPVFTANDSNQMYWTSRIREDREGNLWFATMRRIVKYEPHKKQFTEIASISDERFTRGFCIDSSNVVWCGTTGWGVYISNQNVRRFGAMQGNFLSEVFGKEISLVHRFIQKKNITADISFSLRGGMFPSCIHDRAGNAWLLTNVGLFFHKKDSADVRLISTTPRQYNSMPAWSTSRVYEDREGEIWIGTVGGISKLNKPTYTFEYYRIYPGQEISSDDLNLSSYKDITAIFQDKRGMVWIGTPANGLFRLDPATNEIHNFVNRDGDLRSLSSNHVLSICEDPFAPDSILWIGTDGGGLNRFNVHTGTFSSFTQRNNFPNNVAYGILTDKNNFFWISTNFGLIKMNPKTYEWKQYDVHDGLQSNEFNRNEFYKAPEGKMYFGGIYGYNGFFPETIYDNPVVPHVVLTEFSIFNKTITHSSKQSPLRMSISETRSITLEYSQNMFTLEFAALEFSAPLKNKYAYKLEGFNDDWIYSGTQRQATYTNLDPGEYTFRVKASNGDGVWNDKGTSLAITILPPFYMTWWFRGIVILFFAAAGPSVYFLRVNQLKREQKRQHEVSQMLIESQEQERKRIAQEMHDSLGQELLVIKNRAVMGLKTASAESREKKQLEQISDGATNVLKLVRTISHNLRPPELDRLGLTETIRSILLTIRDATSKTLHAEIDTIDGLIEKENEINLIRILQEAVSNIEKHSGATEITVHLKIEQPNINLLLKDNGRGFAVDAVKHGIGLAGISERVRILHGTLAITSAPAEGTTLSITIPIYHSNG
ncbi:MAG: two-component regulator propeller domain-containing protein [Bacteroidota bacterium]